MTDVTDAPEMPSSPESFTALLFVSFQTRLPMLTDGALKLAKMMSFGVCSPEMKSLM